MSAQHGSHAESRLSPPTISDVTQIQDLDNSPPIGEAVELLFKASSLPMSVTTVPEPIDSHVQTQDGNQSEQIEVAPPVGCDVQSQNLLPGWERRWTVDTGTAYYVDHNTRTTTWTPPPEAETFLRTARRETPSLYKARLLRAADDAKVTWDPPTRNGAIRACLAGRSKGRVFSDLDLEQLISTLDHNVEEEGERVCIIENITEGWLLELGARLDLPPTFVLCHSSHKLRSAKFEASKITDGYLDMVDKTIERLFRFAQHLLSTVKQQQHPIFSSQADPSTDSEQHTTIQTECDALLLRLDELRRHSKFARSTVSQWIYASNPYDDERNLRELHAIRRIYSDLYPVRAAPVRRRLELMMQAMTLTDASLRTFAATSPADWYSMPFVLESENRVESFVDRGDTHVSWNINECGVLSYIRVHRSLFLILVDPKPDAIKKDNQSLGRVGPYWRDKLHFDFPAMGQYNSTSIILPRLFHDQGSGIFESLTAFAHEEWHLDILCSEEEVLPVFDTLARSGAPENACVPPRYATLTPQAFIYLVSSHLWGLNMAFLENKGKRISFYEIRELDATNAIRVNSELNDIREDLTYLADAVTYSDRGFPEDLTAYYDEFPRIRWRHNAAYLSPVDHYKDILSRARSLDELLVDSFKMLMSSVSVQQATLSNQQAAITARLAEDTAKQASASAEQARAATRITALAFVYIPLAFVTGIFGMNVRTGAEEPIGFMWYAPLVTLVVTILFTAGLWYAASWTEIRFAGRREKCKIDVEGGHSAKVKPE